MKRSISGMMGKGSITHNCREFIAENIDRNRTADNITYKNENLKQVYHELFDDALERYNAKQKRSDRKIPDYYEHICRGFAQAEWILAGHHRAAWSGAFAGEEEGTAARCAVVVRTISRACHLSKPCLFAA